MSGYACVQVRMCVLWFVDRVLLSLVYYLLPMDVGDGMVIVYSLFSGRLMFSLCSTG